MSLSTLSVWSVGDWWWNEGGMENAKIKNKRWVTMTKGEWKHWQAASMGLIGDDGQWSAAVPVASSGGQRPGSRSISVTLNWNEWAMVKDAGMVYSGLS